MNRNAVVTIIHNEFKDVLLNKKYLRHSMNRIQRKNHKIGTYEINEISWSCFYDKIYIQSMWKISSLLLELIIKSSYLNNYLKKIFCQANCFNFFCSQSSFFIKHTKFEKHKAPKKCKWRINASSEASK